MNQVGQWILRLNVLFLAGMSLAVQLNSQKDAVQTSVTVASATVRYTANGFSPKETTVFEDYAVIVKNESSKILDLSAKPNTAQTSYKFLKTNILTKRGETTSIFFENPGEFFFNNRLQPSDELKIIVVKTPTPETTDQKKTLEQNPPESTPSQTAPKSEPALRAKNKEQPILEKEVVMDLAPIMTIENKNTRIVMDESLSEPSPEGRKEIIIALGENVERAIFDLSSMIQPSDPSLSGGPSAEITVEINRDITATTQSEHGTIFFKIPKNIVISSDLSWNGELMLPVIKKTASLPIMTDPISQTPITTIHTVIEVGSRDAQIFFSKPVRLFLPKAGGQSAGYIFKNQFTKITDICQSDTWEGAETQLANGKECFMSKGDDLVIWTRHFTEFIAYAESPASKTRDQFFREEAPLYPSIPPQTAATQKTPGIDRLIQTLIGFIMAGIIVFLILIFLGFFQKNHHHHRP